MKFTCSVEIERPIDDVVKVFDNPENLKHWQDGLVSMTHVSGTPGEPGAQTDFVYDSGKHRIELRETIQAKNLPQHFVGLYEAKQMVNTMTNRFTETTAGTRWETEIEYTRFNGFMPKLMAKLFPGMFRKQTQKWLDQFKEFAEKEIPAT